MKKQNRFFVRDGSGNYHRLFSRKNALKMAERAALETARRATRSETLFIMGWNEDLLSFDDEKALLEKHGYEFHQE